MNIRYKNDNLVSKKSFLPSKSTKVECVQLKDKNSEQIAKSQFLSSWQQRTIGHGQSETAKTEAHDMNSDLNKSLE